MVGAFLNFGNYMIQGKNIFWIFFVSIFQAFEYPDFNVLVNNNPYPEDIFINIKSVDEGSNFMAIIDTDLNLKWHVVNLDGKGWDFKVNENGKITYFEKFTGSSSRGVWHVMDSGMQEIKTFECINGYETDNHDIYYLNNGGYILQAYHKEAIDIPQTAHIDTARTLVLQEFDPNDNLVFEWKNSDHMDINQYIDSFNLNTNYLNWMHGNSIEIDTDGHIIISSRTMSEVIKFNRLTGEVIWTLGGPASDFIFIDDPYNGFLGQHDARRLDNGNLLVFDNGSSLLGSPRSARVVEYSLDMVDMTATLAWEYSHPENYIALNQGSSQRLDNGNTIISWGTVSNHGAIITEVTYDKNIVLEIEYPSSDHTYKVRKTDWDFDINLIRGDINLDSVIDILDLIVSVNIILNEESPSIFHLYKIDLNYDATIDILDILAIINIII